MDSVDSWSSVPRPQFDNQCWVIDLMSLDLYQNSYPPCDPHGEIKLRTNTITEYVNVWVGHSN